jgi:hypothetical protein
MSTLCVGVYMHEYKTFDLYKQRTVTGNLQKDIGIYSKVFIGIDT